MTCTVIAPMLATLDDGTTRVVCCGPALLKVEGLVGYLPLYERQGAGVCCHTGGIRRGAMRRIEREARDTDGVYAALGGMLGS